MHFTYTHASIFRVEPCSLDSNQVKLHFGHKIDNGRGLYMKCTHFKFTSFVQQESNNQLIVWQESWAAQIWSRFCGGDPKLLLYIPGFSLVREKKTFAMLTIQVLLLCLIPTSLAQVGVFFIFSKVGLVVEIIITFYQFEQNQWHLLLKVEKRPTNHGCELRSFKTKLFIKLKHTFTWHQVENWKDPGPGWWVVGCGNVPAEPKDWATWRRPPEQPSRACRASNKWTPPDIFSTWSVSPNAILTLDRCATKSKLSYSRFLILAIKGSPRSFEPWSPSVQVHSDLDGKCKTQDGKHQVLAIWQESHLSQELQDLRWKTLPRKGDC